MAGKRILILSCSTGGGHHAAARALEEKLNTMGYEAKALDMMALATKHRAKVVGGIYVGIVKYVPALFRLGYFLGSKLTSRRIWSPVYWLNSRMAPYVEQYLEKFPCDAVLTTHLYCAETLTYMKRKNRLKQPFLFVATDYTCIPFFEETRPDRYVIAQEELRAECVERGIPSEDMESCGIPTALAFSKEDTMEAARKRLGLSQHGKLYLVMAGSMGFGKVPLFAHELVARVGADDTVVIICGNNKRMKRILEHEMKRRERVHVIGYTRQVADYMMASNVVFTKPGGLTTTEAAVRNVPLVHTDPIPGCENCNMEFFQARGMSYGSTRMRTQISQGIMLANDEEMAGVMRKAQRRYIHPDAAERIIELMEQILSEKDRTERRQG